MRNNKKILLVLLIIGFMTLLFSCGKEDTSSLVFSKVYHASTQANNLVELYNPSDVDIDLTSYYLDVYTNGAKESTYQIQLTGTIPAHDYYLIAGQGYNVGVIADFVYSSTLPFNGNDPLVLRLNKTNIDVLGFLGNDIDYNKYATLIRLGNKENYTPYKTYDQFNYIVYTTDCFEYVKNDTHEIKTLENLYAGPRLEDKYLSLPFVSPTNSQAGGGGVITVTLTSIADGDTATFTGNGYNNSTRYYYINTPEVSGGYVNAEPWGNVASKYNKSYLLADPGTKLLQVQSIPNKSLTDSTSSKRGLCLVWVNGYLSQFLIVSEGLTENVPSSYETSDYLLTYKNVPYLTFLRFAEKRAINNGWCTKGYPSNPNGEKAPDWNYQAANGAGAYNGQTWNTVVWYPHLPLPWE